MINLAMLNKNRFQLFQKEIYVHIEMSWLLLIIIEDLLMNVCNHISNVLHVENDIRVHNIYATLM